MHTLALVVLKPGTETEVNPEELRAFVAQFADGGVMPKDGVPDRVQIVEAIAKTSVGKINKKQLWTDYNKKAGLPLHEGPALLSGEPGKRIGLNDGFIPGG